jgi:hypothetical protein
MKTDHPYKSLSSDKFWKTGVVNQNPFFVESIYKKKFTITKESKICTAGSCFAQHISKRLRNFGFNLIDNEPAPRMLPESEHLYHGFSQYSCRYGNIYTIRQLLQLASEAFDEFTPYNYIWEKDGRYYDALRPAVFPGGLESGEEIRLLRANHLLNVAKTFLEMDILILTLGLTEAWSHIGSRTVYPTCPGVVAGTFDTDSFQFENFDYISILNDFTAFLKLLRRHRSRGIRILLTVSPVPLTATASTSHILPAATYSKSVLRSVAGFLHSQYDSIDYFPSFEIVNNPMLHSVAFESNARTVKPEVVDIVMKHLFSEHRPFLQQEILRDNSIVEVACEEMLLGEFS